MPDWQDKSTAKKFIWFILQFILIQCVTIFYIFIRPFQKIWCSNSECCCEKLYEHPYYKFINHTMSYIAFLCVLFASTFGFEHEYRTSTSGLSIIGKLFFCTLCTTEFYATTDLLISEVALSLALLVANSQ